MRTVSLAPALARQSRNWLSRWPVLANAATVGALTTAVKLAAAVKIAVTARYFGAGDELDAYLTAFLIPSIFGDAVAGALTPGLVPSLIRVREQQGEAAAHRLARSGAGVAMAVLFGMAVVFAFAGPWLLPVLGLSYSAAKLRLTATMFFGMLCWLPLGALIAAWRAVLNAHGRFALAAAGPLTAPLLSIAFLYAGGAKFGAYVLAAGTLGGVLLECAWLGSAVRRLGYPAVPSWFPRSATAWTPELCGVCRQFLPLMASAIISSAGYLIDQAFAGALGSGSVSALGYGNKLVGVVTIVAVHATATALLPEFSRLASRNEWRRLRHSALSYGGLLTAVVIPVTAALMWFSEPLVRLFFERGAFDAADTQLVAVVQRFTLMEAPVAVWFAVVSRMATAASANALLPKVGVIALAVNVAADWWFSRWWGVAGLALSPPLVRLVAVILLFLLLAKREPRLFGNSR